MPHARVVFPLALLVACAGPAGDDTDDPSACTDPTVWYADADGDGDGDATTATSACEAPAGYVAIGRDCDDANLAVSSLATEVCNGIDDDCNGKTDGALAVDAPSGWPDADGDGAGDASAEAIQRCNLPDGFVDNADDCDDTNAAVLPGATEHCDGLDNDCDGVTDGAIDVPGDVWTIAEAIALAADGDLICVAAGNYPEAIALSDRALRIEGAGEDTVVDAQGTGRAIDVEGGDVTLGRLTLRGGYAGDGAAAAVSGGRLALEDVAIEAMALELDDPELRGLLVADAATLALTRVDVTNNGLKATDSVGGTLIFGGAVLGATDSDVTWAGGTVANNNFEVALDDKGGQVTFDGLITVHGGTFAASDLVINKNTLAARSIAVSESVGADAFATGALFATDADVTLDGVEVTENTLRVDANTTSLDGAHALPRGWIVQSGGTSTWHDVTFGENTETAVGAEGDVTTLGRLIGVTADWDGVTFRANGLGYHVIAETTCDGLVFADSDVTATQFDLRGTVIGCAATSPPAIGRGVLTILASEGTSTATLTNVVIAGNKVQSDDVVRGPIVVDGGQLTLDQAAITGNVLEANFIDGGVVALYRGASLAFDHATIDTNVAKADARLYGGIVYDAALADDDDATFTTRYSSFYGNATKVVLTRSDGRTEGASADDGNLVAPPGYTSTSGKPATWDLHLSPASVLIDSGDTKRRDPDGSVADIGAYGGPGGDW